MTIKNRLQRLEAGTGLDRPCYLCGKCQAAADAMGNYLRRHGIKFPPSRLVMYECFYCGRARLFQADDLDDTEIAECRSTLDEMKRALREGLEFPESVVKRCEEYAERYDARLRRILGEHFDGAKQAGKDAEEQFTAEYVQRYLRPISARGNRR